MPDSIETTAPEVIVTSREGEAPMGVVLRTMTPFAQALVRAARTFVQSLVAFLLLSFAGRPMLDSVGVIVPPGDFLAALQTSVGLALAPTVISLLQNLAEIFARLDERFPKMRA